MAYFGYSKWEDVGLEYNSTNYEWYVIQTRTRNRDNYRQFRNVKVQKYGTLTSDTVNSIQSIIKSQHHDTDNSK